MGDSNDISTFSGIPFFLSKELESRGIFLNRVNLYPCYKLVKWYNRTISRLVHVFKKDSLYDFSRSVIFDWIIKSKIKRANRNFPEAEASLFVTYCAHNSKSNHINILFGDWVFEYLLEGKPNRDIFERRYVKRENNYIAAADLTISLFPKSADYIKSKVSTANVVHLGLNVVNDYNDSPLDVSEILKKKVKRREILFIGRGYYLEGLYSLLEAFVSIKHQFPDIILNVIGLNRSDVDMARGELPDDIHFWGYLRKNNDSERKIYYRLLNNASLFINTTSKWAGYSSMIEAMYYYTPIITSPYNEFVEEFGRNIKFGKYHDGKILLSEIIADLLSEDINVYIERCILSNSAVANHTWTNYVDELIKKMRML